jgi:DNA-binding SARP family transcriptional activator
MHVGVLGPLFVRVDERDVTPRGQRLRDLFVVLLQRRERPVSAQQLLELVWREQATRLDVSAVHTVVARLRRQLGAGTVRSKDGGYLIDRSTTTDESAFDERVGRGRDQLLRGEPTAACAEFRAALSLWRAPDAFDDIHTELVEADRCRLAELRVAASEELAATLLAQPSAAGLAEASTLTAELISDRPLRERPYQLAMLAAYRSHRQSDALQIYQDLRGLLRTELGIEPMPATANLHAMVLRQDPSLSPAAGHRAPPASRPTRLPAPVSPLIGRKTELAAVRTALAGGRRLISVIGPGGVGKSRLLAEVGAAWSQSETAAPKRLLYTEMSGLSQVGPAEVAEAIAVGRLVIDGLRAPLDSLVAALGEDSWLLLID